MSSAPPLFSIVIPAHNEEKYLPRGLAAVSAAQARVAFPVEVIVVDNASTDRTAELARAWGASVVREDKRQIARVRNTGVAAARGEFVLTVDADSAMHPDTLRVAADLLRRGDIVGGSVKIVPDEMNLLIWLGCQLLTITIVTIMRLGGGIYFLRRADFIALGGFNEELYAVEDLDFARRLKALGRARGQRYLHWLKEIPLLTSARKFHLIRHRHIVPTLLRFVFMPNRLLREKKYWDFLFYGKKLR